MKKINGVLVIFGIISAIVFIELLFRVFPGLIPAETLYVIGVLQFIPENPDGIGWTKDTTLYVDDPYLIYKLKPGIDISAGLMGDNVTYNMKTTSLGFEGIGFRDDGLNSPEPFGVVVGDSFTFGFGVEMNAR